MQDLEDVQLLPDDGAEHQEQQPRRIISGLDVGLRFLGGLAVHRHRWAPPPCPPPHWPGPGLLPEPHPCSPSLPAASSDNLARLWCVETGEIKREYGGHQKAVVCLAFNDSVLG